MKTDWFPNGVKPVREGVYETTHGYQWYSPHSDTWFGYTGSARDAEDLFIRGFTSAFQRPKWRGLTKKQ